MSRGGKMQPLQKLTIFLPAFGWCCALLFFICAMLMFTGADGSLVLTLLAIVFAAASAFMVWHEFRRGLLDLDNIKSGRGTRKEQTRRQARYQNSLPVMTAEQRATAFHVLDAFNEAGLAVTDDEVRAEFIRVFNEDGWGPKPIGAYETLITLRDLWYEHDMSPPQMMFTHENIEHNAATIEQTICEILALFGHDPASATIEMPAAVGPAGDISIAVTLEDKTYHLPCTLRPKNTPDGLIEQLYQHIPKRKAGQLYVETLDTSLIYVILTESAANAFNAKLADLGDPFQWKTVSPSL